MIMYRLLGYAVNEIGTIVYIRAYSLHSKNFGNVGTPVTLINDVYFVLNGGNGDVHAESRDVVVTLSRDSDSLRAETCRNCVELDHNCKDCRNRR